MVIITSAAPAAMCQTVCRYNVTYRSISSVITTHLKQTTETLRVNGLILAIKFLVLFFFFSS